MYITRTKKRVGAKEYRSVLLVESVRIDGKPRHRTILNLTQWREDQINALEFSLKGKAGIAGLGDVEAATGKGIGGVLVVEHLAKKLGIMGALGTTQQAKLAMVLIAGRVLAQGSRLSLCEWQTRQEIEAVLGVASFTEDDLYKTLDWLSETQAKIEKRLFAKRTVSEKKPALFLYDITSSYVEGTDNELAKYGYNRDGKKGKQQIVIGLLTDEAGVPVSVEVFEGNQSDSTTVSGQIEKMAKQFGVTELVLVGDKGMIKRAQIDSFGEGVRYITSITRKQIEGLVKSGVIQLSLFENELVEVEHNQCRYVLRKNPIREAEIQRARSERLATLEALIVSENSYLATHPKASGELRVTRLTQKIRRFHLHSFCTVTLTERTLTLIVDPEKQTEISRYDGCYALTTDLTKEQLSKESVHARYKDLAKVEHAFRTIKTGFLEIRPLFVRKATRTRGHVFVTMLAYMVTQDFAKMIKPLEMTTDSAWSVVSQLQTVSLSLPDPAIKTIKKIQPPSQNCQAIFQALALKIPNLSFPPVA